MENLDSSGLASSCSESAEAVVSRLCETVEFGDWGG